GACRGVCASCSTSTPTSEPMTSVISTSGAPPSCALISATAHTQPRAKQEEPMIVVVSPEATQDDIASIVRRIEDSGRQAHISVGTERTIIGVIGPELPELQDMFETLPHVES